MSSGNPGSPPSAPRKQRINRHRTDPPCKRQLTYPEEVVLVMNYYRRTGTMEQTFCPLANFLPSTTETLKDIGCYTWRKDDRETAGLTPSQMATVQLAIDCSMGWKWLGETDRFVVGCLIVVVH